MAIEHARLCESCDRQCPSWADRCPACGSTSMVHRIVLIPPSPSSEVHSNARPPASSTRRKRAGATASRRPAHKIG